VGKEKERRRRRRSTSSGTKGQVRIFFRVLLFCPGIKEDSFREREKDEGSGNKTPIDRLSRSQ